MHGLRVKEIQSVATVRYPYYQERGDMSESTLDRVVECFAATTRYPKELLTPDAELENGLGIDSVKRVELVIALGEEFGLDLQSEVYDPEIKTIQDIARWIDGVRDADTSASTPRMEPEADSSGVPRAPQAVAPTGPPERFGERLAARETPNETSGHNLRSDRIASRLPAPQPHFQARRKSVGPEAMPKPLDGRVALVTGSGRGVGRITAHLLADRGATVIINSFHSREQGEQAVEEINANGGSAVHMWGSVANPDHVDNMFDEIEHQFGLDILVCNASDGRIGHFLELTHDDWERAFRTNVIGHHHCAVRAAKLMHPRGGGSIVTMSAVGAHQFIDGLGSQGVAKAAVESLTRYLACTLGPTGIRVNCVSGGPIYGDLLDSFPDAMAAQNHWESMTPDGELCSPMDIARTIAFLVSDEARGINGAVWMADHGFSATADGQRYRHTPNALAQASLC
jgi:enoyl-[acyl-carrier protein] reductase III